MTDSSPAVGHQHEVEVILFKQVASYLATPIFVVDPDGSLAYYNEPAERLLGCRYDETGAMPMSEWSTIFVPRDEQGAPLPTEALPLALALERHEPAHGDMWITGLDGAYRHISVTAFPLVGQGDRDLGAVAIFWESGA
ncbi:MAG TPA: PAS domain-containing protein [Acidimicrobiia bacterium]|nr:PAS domain-containing protein [Acidimicrobiia bacterium]